jgi:hypothetical protein
MFLLLRATIGKDARPLKAVGPAAHQSTGYPMLAAVCAQASGIQAPSSMHRSLFDFGAPVSVVCFPETHRAKDTAQIWQRILAACRTGRCLGAAACPLLLIHCWDALFLDDTSQK